ncbi:MAG: ABC transporter permease [Synoicihabitans sp.]
MDEELAFHFDELVAENERRGMSTAEAQRMAKRKLGNTTLTQESYRDQAGWPVIDDVLRDARLAVRNLRRRPGYATTMIGLLGIGLAAALTVFVLTDAMLRRNLPVPNPHELHLLASEDGFPDMFARSTVEQFATNLPASRVIAYGGSTRVTLQRQNQPAIAARAQLVSGGALPGLEIVPAAGRLLSPGDDRIGEGAPVAVVSLAWARREYGTAAAAVGQELRVNRLPIEIVGVLPEGFGGFETVERIDLFLPTALQLPLALFTNSSEFASDDRDNDPDWNRESRIRWLQVMVRVPAGESVEAVQPAFQVAVRPYLDDLISQLDSPREREEMERLTWQVIPAPGGFSSQRNAFSDTGKMLTGLVVSLLLLTCANLSGIMLVRTLSRHREMGVRMSLGAGRWRTCRLALVEAMVCGLFGAMLGLLLAGWMVPAAAELLIPGVGLRLEVVGWNQLAVLVGVALISSLGCALVPAWWISKLQPLIALNGAMGGGSIPQRVGRVLVSVQLALAVMLVAVSLSLGQEISSVLARDPGFARSEVLTATFSPRNAGYTDETVEPLFERLRETMQKLPGVEQVDLAANGILAGSRSSSTIFPRDPELESRAGAYQQDSVGPTYLQTVGMRLLQGRWFETTDGPDTPNVVIVTAAFARTFWGTTDVIGKRMGYDYEATDEDMTVVGVLADAGINRARDAETEMFFLPQSQSGWDFRFMAVRVQRNPDAMRRIIVDALAGVEPGLVFGNWQTLGERREGNLRREIASSRLAAIIAVLSLILATFGVGGALAHLVTLRQKELAVRAALGATPSRLMRGVMGDGVRLGIWGAVGGGGLILLIVLGVPVLGWWEAVPDKFTSSGAVVAGLLAALAGCWLPAKRASRVDPQRLLKSYK